MVKSAVRVMQILKIIGSSRDGLKHLEISRALKIPKGSLSFLLADLVNEEFIFLEKDGRYKIGPQVMVLAGRYIESLDVVKLCMPFIKELVMISNESAGLSVPMGDNIVVIVQEGANQYIKLEYKIGETLPMYASSSGKAILANYSSEDLERYLSSVKLEQITSSTITDKDKLLYELEKIKKEGIAFSMEEMFEGRVGIAAPVFQKNGSVIAALSQPIPSMRFNPEKEKIIKEALLKISRDLSRKLGYY